MRERFQDLKNTLFNIIQGRHILTRNTELKACNTYIATPPCHIDTNRIVLRATFGGQGEENVLNIRGDTDNSK